MRAQALSACAFVSAVMFLSALPAQARITLDLDYTYDTNGFFNPSTTNGQAARAALSAAADYYSDRFLDSFVAITPGGQNTWTPNISNPGNGSNLDVPGNPAIAANSVKIYAGGYVLGGSTLGIGGPGGFSAGGFQPFFDAIQSRGQSGALASTPTDYGPWGGSITFNTPTNWNFNVLNAPTSSAQSDFLSVALHELGHLLGVGTAGSFVSLSSGLTFNGPKSTALYGGPVPLGDSGHLGSINSTVTGSDTQQVVMSPSIVQGTRKLLTVLDWAAFDDLGWDLARPGDANASGSVDFDDLLVLAKNYGGSGLTWSEGDFNYDHSVNFNDLLLLAKNYGASGSLPASAELSSAFKDDWTLARSLVPEPTAIVGIALLASTLVRRRTQH